jgi:bifunctional ADP-heptose synthase (sugar kinase/adenylyltransferase)
MGQLRTSHLLGPLRVTVCGNLTHAYRDDTPIDLIQRPRPSVLVKGGDYRKETVVGHELVEADGGEVILVDLVPGHSTTKIVERSGGAAIDGAKAGPAKERARS